MDNREKALIELKLELEIDEIESEIENLEATIADLREAVSRLYNQAVELNVEPGKVSAIKNTRWFRFAKGQMAGQYDRLVGMVAALSAESAELEVFNRSLIIVGTDYAIEYHQDPEVIRSTLNELTPILTGETK